MANQLNGENHNVVIVINSNICNNLAALKSSIPFRSRMLRLLHTAFQRYENWLWRGRSALRRATRRTRLTSIGIPRLAEKKAPRRARGLVSEPLSGAGDFVPPQLAEQTTNVSE
jgi:hypothetical protein